MPAISSLQRKIAKVGVLLLLGAGWAAAAADSLPVTQAETLTGQKLEFPTALAGKPAVCVFGFSKEAGDRTKVWMTQLSQDGINAWSVANLESAPALVRGMIRSSMRKGTPQPLLERSLILTKDEKAWKHAVGANQSNLPVVVVFDAAGHPLWTYEGLFADEPYREIKTRLDAATR
jgi:hypothetical protein